MLFGRAYASNFCLKPLFADVLVVFGLWVDVLVLVYSTCEALNKPRCRGNFFLGFGEVHFGPFKWRTVIRTRSPPMSVRTVPSRRHSLQPQYAAWGEFMVMQRGTENLSAGKGGGSLRPAPARRWLKGFGRQDDGRGFRPDAVRKGL